MMNRKEYKLLVEGWRGFLNESVGLDNVLSKIDYLEEKAKRSGENIVIIYKEESEGYGGRSEVCGKIEYSGYHAENSFDGDVLSGSIEFESTEENWPEGFALGGYRILETYKTTKGFGPLLYEIIIEKVSEKDSFLMSDRHNVTAEARRVWDIYMSRPDIQKIQLDINEDESEDIGIEQLTPEYPDDDTSMESAIADKGTLHWMDSSLSKGYYKIKGNTPVLDRLRESKFIDFIES